MTYLASPEFLMLDLPPLLIGTLAAMADALEIPLGTLKSRMHDLVARHSRDQPEWRAP